MSIRFGEAEWATVRDDYRRFWSGELDRPICPIVIEPPLQDGEAPPRIPFARAAFADLSVSVEQLLDHEEWRLSRLTFLRDSFPWVNLACSGPGILAAMLGANLHAAAKENTIWFEAGDVVPIRDLHLEFDPENVWSRRIKDLCRSATQRWKGNVLVSYPDLGGNLDVLATFRTSQGLLLDLYDHPREVERLIWEAHDCWHAALVDVTTALGGSAPGHSSWSGLYCQEPMYMLQCDFAYMIGPDMFEAFVVPELTATCQRLSHSFYHWDGVGQLVHADHLLGIESLDGVQWVPGDGKPPAEEWPQVFERILAAGKRAQLLGNADALIKLAHKLGRWKGIATCHSWFAAYPNADDAYRALDDVMMLSEKYRIAAREVE